MSRSRCARKPGLFQSAFLLAVLVLPAPAVGGDVGRPEIEPVIYVPPSRGAPERRVGGGTRNVRAGVPQLEALAPNHPGRTRLAQPVLYFQLSRGEPRRVDFALYEEGETKPVVEATVAEHFEGGVGSVDLAALDVRLETGKLYHWYVAVAAEGRQGHRVDGGAIERVGVMDAVLVPETDAARVYAESGFFYDALSALEVELEESEDDGAWRGLLEQVGIAASPR